MIFSGEHFLVFFIVVLFFGPRIMPAIGQTLGKSLRNFKDMLGGVQEPTYRKISETVITPTQHEERS